MIIEFIVVGEPRPRQAPKVSFRHRKVVMVPDQKSKRWERDIALIAKTKAPEKLLDEPLFAVIGFYLPRPKSRPKKDRYPDRQPDLDNCEKPLFDAMEGIIYLNDSRIVVKHVGKSYSDNPRVHIKIMTMEE